MGSWDSLGVPACARISDSSAAGWSTRNSNDADNGIAICSQYPNYGMRPTLYCVLSVLAGSFVVVFRHFRRHGATFLFSVDESFVVSLRFFPGRGSKTGQF
jgi:hypothetical protein